MQGGSIPSGLEGERADKIVAQLAGVSRSAARALFDSDPGVLVDGRRVAANERLAGGVLAFSPPETAETVAPEVVSFGVIHEDNDLIVIDKPAGIVVHPGAGQSRGTLVAGLLERYPELEGVGQSDRWGLVHRLDKETSGLLLVARTTESYERLVADLAARRIHRRYLALVHGAMEMATGTIDAPIGRDPLHPTRKRVTSDGRPARTHYRLLGTVDELSLLELTLETGRTHQIRVHLAAIEHAVVGDRTYSREQSAIPLRRMFLHAAKLDLVHPTTRESHSFASPLPAELADFLRRMGSFPI